MVEIQVRTIFEEGWSEIDHNVRYPRLSSDPYLTDFLTMFNRLAGSADEMGTFIKALSQHLTAMRNEIASKDEEIRKLGESVAAAVEKLRIGDQEKQQLKDKVEELRKASIDLSGFKTLTQIKLPELSKLSISAADIRPFSELKKRCAECGTEYIPSIAESMMASSSDRCEACRKLP